VVVTGQQVGLFLGPLYTIYKAASAVVLARALAAETGTPVVPVFWLQTEDHDLPEIASLGVPGACACEMITAPVDADNRISIAHRTLPAEVAGCLDRLGDVLGEGALAAAHIERLRRHYRAGEAWADAFAGVLAELFAPEGLVMIDPRGHCDPVLAAIAAPIHARALDQAGPIAAAMIAQCEALVRAGRSVPVHVRPGAPLSFFHPDGALGPRVRLEPASPETHDAFAEVGTGRVHPRSALLAALADDPRRFSTSALLRPIVQDTLFPTICYVAGPNELAYLGQLRGVYEHFGVPMPLMYPRATATLLDAAALRFLNKYKLPLEALQPQDEAALNELLKSQIPPAVEESFAEAAQAIETQMTRLIQAMPALDPTLEGAVRSTLERMQRDLQTLHGKMIQAAKRRDETLRRQFIHARDLAFPGSHAQERTIGFVSFLNQYGPALVDRLDEELPLDLGRHWIVTI